MMARQFHNWPLAKGTRGSPSIQEPLHDIFGLVDSRPPATQPDRGARNENGGQHDERLDAISIDPAVPRFAKRQDEMNGSANTGDKRTQADSDNDAGGKATRRLSYAHQQPQARRRDHQPSDNPRTDVEHDMTCSARE